MLNSNYHIKIYADNLKKEGIAHGIYFAVFFENWN